MIIKDFKTFFVNENTEFTDNLIEDSAIKTKVKDIIELAIENLDGKNITDIEDLKEIIDGVIHVDSTNILDFDLDKKLDLCIYAEEISGDKCPETSFDELTLVIDKFATIGLKYIVSDYLEPLFSRLATYMIENDLNYNEIHAFERFGGLAPLTQKDIKDGYYSIYQEADTDPKFAEYCFIEPELNVEFFITKTDL